VSGKKGEYKKPMAEMLKEGFLRARIDGKFYDLEDPPELDKQKKHTIELVVDRLVAKPATDEEYRKRLADSIETATRVSGGLVTISVADGPEEVLSANYSCPDCGTSLTEITPRLFSFNSPYGACAKCSGLGTILKADPDRLVVAPEKSIADGAIAIMKSQLDQLALPADGDLAKHYKFRLDQPFSKLPKPARQVILYGSGEDEIKFSYVAEKGEYHWRSSFEGLIPMVERRYRETENSEHRSELEAYMSAEPCPGCAGRRLKPEALAVKVGGRAIDEVAGETISGSIAFFEELELSPREREIAGRS
jgi:excinuclease ABC subunit A